MTPEGVGARKANDYRWGGENEGIDRIVNPNTHHGSESEKDPVLDHDASNGGAGNGNSVPGNGLNRSPGTPARTVGPDGVDPVSVSSSNGGSADFSSAVSSSTVTDALTTSTPQVPAPDFAGPQAGSAPLAASGRSGGGSGTPDVPANHGPVAADDTGSSDEDGSVSGNVLSNDTDADTSDVLTVAAVNGQMANVGASVSGSYGSVVIGADGSYSFTPNGAANALAAGETATDTFTYTVSDGNGGTATASLTITITGTNDGPVANSDAGSTDEDTVASGNVLPTTPMRTASDVLAVSAVNGQAGNVGVSVAGSYGSVVIGADGSYSFTPNAAANALAAGETATDTFTYTVSDGNGGTATASLTITITGTNDGPVAVADTAGTDEDASVSGNVLANDTDADSSDVLSVAAVNGQAANVGVSVAGTYGSVVIGADGSYSFTPNAAANALAAGETATDTFTYTVSDGNGGTATASLTITITGTNDGPVANADTGSTTDDAAVAGNVLANDTDADASDVLTVSAVNGQAGNVGSAVAGSYGSLVIGADGSYSFTPNSAANALAAGETATDTFTYTVSDGNGGTATAPASLTITITGTNDGPVATTDTAATDEDVAVSGNVLANDSDVDASDVLSVAAVNGSAANVGSAVAGSYGSVVIGADGSYSFTPNAAANALAAGETATDTFTYTVSDGNGGTATASLTITITGTNDGPVAVADTAGTDEDVAVSGNVLSNDSDVDASDVLSVAAVNSSAGNVGSAVAGTYGSVVIGSDGSYSFTPNGAANALAAGETASDTFTYTVSDGNGGTATASLTITITGTNDGPVAVADTAATDEDASVSGNVLANDTDADSSDVLSVAAVNGQAGNVGSAVAGSYGSLVIGADGSYSFTPNSAANALAAGETATDTFTYTVSDGNGGTATASLTITITGTNDGPVAVADTAGTDEDSAVSGNVLANDTDADSSDVLSVAAVNGQAANVGGSVAGTYGSVVIGADGSYSFTPNSAANALAAGETATDTFTYTVSDGNGGTATASLTITITGTNDGPVAVANTAAAQEDVTTSATGNVLTNDTDVDSGDTKTVAAVNGVAGNVGASVAGTYGSVVIGSNGAYTYTLNNGSAAVQGLRAGQTVTDTFNYTMRDAAGATSSTTLTVTVTGTNDAPVAVANTAAASGGRHDVRHRQRAHQRHRRRLRRHQDGGCRQRGGRQCRRFGRGNLWLGRHRVQRRLHLYAEQRLGGRPGPSRWPDRHRHLQLYDARCGRCDKLDHPHRHRDGHERYACRSRQHGFGPGRRHDLGHWQRAHQRHRRRLRRHQDGGCRQRGGRQCRRFGRGNLWLGRHRVQRRLHLYAEQRLGGRPGPSRWPDRHGCVHLHDARYGGRHQFHHPHGHGEGYERCACRSRQHRVRSGGRHDVRHRQRAHQRHRRRLRRHQDGGCRQRGGRQCRRFGRGNLWLGRHRVQRRLHLYAEQRLGGRPGPSRWPDRHRHLQLYDARCGRCDKLDHPHRHRDGHERCACRSRQHRRGVRRTSRRPPPATCSPTTPTSTPATPRRWLPSTGWPAMSALRSREPMARSSSGPTAPTPIR